MLSEKKRKCAYCNRACYFYVFMEAEEAQDMVAIFTQCPKCKEYADCYYISKDKAPAVLAAVMTGNEPPRD